MSDRKRRSEEPGLFDLPLDAPPEEPAQAEEPTESDLPQAPGEGAAADPGPDRGPGALPLFPDLEELPRRHGRRAPLDLPPSRGTAPPESEEPEEEEPQEPEERPRPVAARPAEPRLASLGSRWLAGLLDLGSHVAVSALLIAGTWLLGARVERGELGALILFLMVFSFLYTVYPLAFWGQTPGMLRARIVARSEEQGALTFGQTALRWLGGLLTAALLGLPSLLALVGGRSLTDRLSGTRTWEL